MNHDDAMKMMAAERYILGELEPAERDAFEEHFFDCSVCADDIRDSAKFAAGVRTSDARVKRRPAARFNLWATAAASFFAAALGYQSLVVIPQMRMAMHTKAAPVTRLAAEMPVLDSQFRGAAENVFRVRRDEAVPLSVVIHAPEPHPVYICEIRDSTGRMRASVSVPAKDASDPVPLVVAPGVLSSGDYKLIIRGGDREIAAYPFTMEVR